jgi:DNA-directed RNA polymerase specialized sigma24 family protein
LGVLERGRPPRRDWATTQWSAVVGLTPAAPERREASWTWLATTYQVPLERYAAGVLARVRGRSSADEAAEVVQDFLATCLEKRWLERADRSRGSFRAFVRVLLRRFVYAGLRGGRSAARTLSLDAASVEEPAGEDRSAVEAFDREFVRVAVDRALETLRQERERYHAVIVDLIATDGQGSADLAARMGVSSAQLPVLRHRARKRFARLFEEEVAATVGDDDAFDDEWRVLAPYLP